MGTLFENRWPRLLLGLRSDQGVAALASGHARGRDRRSLGRHEHEASLNAAGERRPTRIDYGFLLYFYLHMTGFLATTLLITWGLFVLFFLAIGGLSVDGMMHQLNNMASRYVEADAARIASFKHVLIAAHTLLSAAVIFFRRHSILPARDPQRSKPNG